MRGRGKFNIISLDKRYARKTGRSRVLERELRMWKSRVPGETIELLALCKGGGMAPAKAAREHARLEGNKLTINSEFDLGDGRSMSRETVSAIDNEGRGKRLVTAIRLPDIIGRAASEIAAGEAGPLAEEKSPATGLSPQKEKKTA